LSRTQFKNFVDGCMFPAEAIPIDLLKIKVTEEQIVCII
jgi:hypothetical protein